MKASPYIEILPGIRSYGPDIEIPEEAPESVAVVFGEMADGTIITACGVVSPEGELRHNCYWNMWGSCTFRLSLTMGGSGA